MCLIISVLIIVKRFTMALQEFFRRKTANGNRFALVILKNIKL